MAAIVDHRNHHGPVVLLRLGLCGGRNLLGRFERQSFLGCELCICHKCRSENRDREPFLHWDSPSHYSPYTSTVGCPLVLNTKETNPAATAMRCWPPC